MRNIALRSFVRHWNQFISAITVDGTPDCLRGRRFLRRTYHASVALALPGFSARIQRLQKETEESVPSVAAGMRKDGANRIVIKRGGRGGASCWSARDNGRLTEYDLCPNITGQR